MRIIAAVLVAAGLSGCSSLAPGRRLHRSESIPEAVGVVSFKALSADETLIELRVRRLSDPERLTPPGYAYVTWVRSTPNDAAQNVGSLWLDSDLDGELRTVAPLRRFELFVTAEPSGDAEKPTGERLLWATRD